MLPGAVPGRAARGPGEQRHGHPAAYRPQPARRRGISRRSGPARSRSTATSSRRTEGRASRQSRAASSPWRWRWTASCAKAPWRARRCSSRIAAVSCAVVGGDVVLNPCYAEDHVAEVDANLVVGADGRFIEVQCSAEGRPFDEGALRTMLAGWRAKESPSSWRRCVRCSPAERCVSRDHVVAPRAGLGSERARQRLTSTAWDDVIVIDCDAVVQPWSSRPVAPVPRHPWLR